MTGTATTRTAGTRDGETRPAVPAPRRSPEESPEEITAQESYDYPLIRYAMEHATGLRPDRR